MYSAGTRIFLGSGLIDSDNKCMMRYETSFEILAVTYLWLIEACFSIAVDMGEQYQEYL